MKEVYKFALLCGPLTVILGAVMDVFLIGIGIWTAVFLSAWEFLFFFVGVHVGHVKTIGGDSL